MAVLSDAEILNELENGSLSIEPFNESNITPNGYDVTIQEILIPLNCAALRALSSSRREHGLRFLPLSSSNFHLISLVSCGSGRPMSEKVFCPASVVWMPVSTGP